MGRYQKLPTDRLLLHLFPLSKRLFDLLIEEKYRKLIIIDVCFFAIPNCFIVQSYLSPSLHYPLSLSQSVSLSLTDTCDTDPSSPCTLWIKTRLCVGGRIVGFSPQRRLLTEFLYTNNPEFTHSYNHEHLRVCHITSFTTISVLCLICLMWKRQWLSFTLGLR